MREALHGEGFSRQAEFQHVCYAVTGRVLQGSNNQLKRPRSIPVAATDQQEERKRDNKSRPPADHSDRQHRRTRYGWSARPCVRGLQPAPSLPRPPAEPTAGVATAPAGTDLRL